MLSQSRGVPRPGWVFTVIHHMWSVPSSCVQSTLQATEQVWQPMHLLRSNTQASWRREAVAFGFGIMAISVPVRAAKACLLPRYLFRQALHVHINGAVYRDGLPGQGPVLEVAVPRGQAQPLD